MNYFDIHSHLQDTTYDSDREDVIARMRGENISTILVGTDRKMSEDAVMLAEKYNLYATIGQHPTDIPDEVFDYDFYKRLASSKKVVAIGECGIDYYRLKTHDSERMTEKKRQEELFRKQIELAIEVGKPLMIHGRPSLGSQDAYDDILDIVMSSGLSTLSHSGNIHFFAGNWQTAQKFLDLGFTLSFTGVITFTHDYDEVVRNVPLGMILTETDSPYVAPALHRGKRNEPLYVKEVIKRIAEIKGETLEKVAEATYENAQRVFSLAEN